MGIELTEYKNANAARLTNSRYSAIITYGRGCSLVEFNDIENDLFLLHYPEPEDTEEYNASPQRFGSALLFPPNKMRHGAFRWNNRVYDLEAHHIPWAHGLIKEFPFEIVSSRQDDTDISVEFRFHSIDSVYYKEFGWDFTCTLIFTLSPEGMTRRISFTNNGEAEIPFGFGLHTAFRIPQNDSFTKEDYRIMVSCGQQWQLDEHGFPTEKLLPPVYGFNEGNISPLAVPMAEHLQAVTLEKHHIRDMFHGAVIRNLRTNTELVYETDPVFAHWMIWNKNAADNFICIEPMTCIINAPNTNIPENVHGFISIKPHACWEAKNRLYVKP